MRLQTIHAGNFKLDGGAMFGVVPKSLWNRLNPADENNMCSWAMRCLLVESEGHRLLIDTGMGNKQDEKFFSFYYLHGEHSLLGSLHQAGLAEADITDVLLTHLHFDHCGGAVKREGESLLPQFSQARYWSNQAHWDWAVTPNPREKASFLKENILPLQQSGQLHMAEASKPFAIPGVELLYVDGHTEKMMLPLIHYKGHKICYMADLLPSAGHIPLPYIMAYDMRPLVTLAEKESLLNRAVDENWVLFFEHDPVVECATLQRTDKGMRLGETLTLADLG